MNMLITAIFLLCFTVGLGDCLPRDHTAFLRDLEKTIRNEIAILELEEFVDGADKKCSCQEKSCSCCVDIKFFTSKVSVCGIATFEPDESVNITLTVNGMPLGSIDVKGANPPSLCRTVQKLNVCLIISNFTIDPKEQTFSGCANITFLNKNVFLGCFHSKANMLLILKRDFPSRPLAFLWRAPRNYLFPNDKSGPT